MGMFELGSFNLRDFLTGGQKPSAPTQPQLELGKSDVRSYLSGSDSQDVKEIISGAAKKHGVPEDLLHNIANAESSLKSNAANPKSSAKGLFQFVDTTWRGMGGRPGEQADPIKNADFGAQYTRQNVDTLRSKLGRDPTYGEVYAAHHFGPGVAKMLNRASPNAPIESGLSTFNSPQQVRAIMRQNPQLRGKTVGQVLNSLDQKVGNKPVGSGLRADAMIGEESGQEPVQLAQADDSYEAAWLDDDQQQAA